MCLAIPGRIAEFVPGQKGADIVEMPGVRREGQLGLQADYLLARRDRVLIHVRFAVWEIRESDAAEQMRLISILGEVDQAMKEVRGYCGEDTRSETSAKLDSKLPVNWAAPEA